MKGFFYSIAVVLFPVFICACRQSGQPVEVAEAGEERPVWGLVVHGGAGNLSEEVINAELDSQYRASLSIALHTGAELLRSGGSSLDAVEAVIRILEDNPLFNAGKGAAFSHEGRNELDASVMSGRDLSAGAVAGVTEIKNPISAARAVMEKSGHVMLSGKGAVEFARIQGLEIVDPEYFHTDRKWNDLKEKLKQEKNGTVGCVALDKLGNLAAGTSTGGMANKRWGRIGDSPVIGAGTYANNATCAVSCTGVGEYFIRYAVAHDISALMEYMGLPLQQAADTVVMHKLVKAGGSGGVIGIDRKGNTAMTFNTSGMFRAFALSDGSEGVFIYREN